MAATHICIIYNTATRVLNRVVVPDRDSQVTLSGGPCTAQSNESVALMTMTQWLSNPTIAAARAFIQAGRNFMLGADAGNNTGSSPNAETVASAIETALGFNLESVGAFADPGSSFAVSTAGIQTFAQRRQIIWSMGVCKNDGSGDNCQNTINGNNDAGFQNGLNFVATQIAAGWHIPVIRLGWEMNLQNGWSWNTAQSGSSTTQYIGAFRRLAALIRSTLPAVKIDWCPGGPSTATPPDAWYPGDDVVDIVGLDIYDATGNINDNVSLAFSQPTGYNWLDAFTLAGYTSGTLANPRTSDKIIGIDEIGTNFDNTTFTTQTFNFVNARNLRFHHFNWWNDGLGYFALKSGPAGTPQSTTLVPVWQSTFAGTTYTGTP